MRLKCFFLVFVCRFDGLNIYIYILCMFLVCIGCEVLMCVCGLVVVESWMWGVVERDRGEVRKRGYREEKVLGAEMWKREGVGVGWLVG